MVNKVVLIEQPSLGMIYLENCNLIIEISGRNGSQASQLNGKSSENKVVIRHEHFSKLFGNSLEVTNENEEIPPVFENLKIKYDIFTLDEYKKINKM